MIKEHNGFKVGDKVKVINTGGHYCAYEKMAMKLKAKNWISGCYLSKNIEATIINFGEHETENSVIIALILTKEGEEHLISADPFYLHKIYVRKGKVKLTAIA